MDVETGLLPEALVAITLNGLLCDSSIFLVTICKKKVLKLAGVGNVASLLGLCR